MTPDLAARHDRASRHQRREHARWLDQQAGASGHRRIVLLQAFDAAGLILFLMLVAALLARLVDGGPLSLRDPTLLAALFLPAGIALLRLGVRRLSDDHSIQLAREVICRLHARALETAQSPAARLQLGKTDADLAISLREQLQALKPWYREYLPARTLAVCQPILILVIAFALDWLAALILLLSAPLIPLFSALIGLGTASLAEAQQSRLNRMGHHFLDRIRALSSLRLFRRGETEARAVKQAAEAYRESSMRVLRVAFLSSAVLEFFSAVAIATLAIYIGMALLGYIGFGPASELRFQAGLGLLLLAPEFFQPLRRLAGGYHERAAAVAAVPAIRALLKASNHPEESHSEESPVPPQTTPARWSSPPGIRLDNLSIAWPGTQPILKALNADFPAGQWTAILGASGSGKSTLAAALLGWLPAHGGQILIGNRPLNTIPAVERQFNLAWLGQQPHLLPLSLRRNLDPAGQHDDYALVDMLTQLGLGGLPNAMEQGLDSRLGERGAGLSGGEAQRLALGRALLCRPRLMVLDEPSASLDADSEAQVLAVLARQRKKTDIIMFTHSGAAAAAADCRLRLEEGRLHAIR